MCLKFITKQIDQIGCHMFINRQNIRKCITLFVSSALLTLSFCGVSIAGDGQNIVIDEEVQASVGGEFSDNIYNSNIVVTIPPGALTHDAKLRVILSPSGQGRLTEIQTSASNTYIVKLKKDGNSGRNGKLEITQPIKLGIKADFDPMLHQLGEIAFKENGRWQRMRANVYQRSNSTVVTLTTQTRGEYRVIHRTLQAQAGEAVERGRELYFNETWTSENYWGGTYELHQTLNNVDPLTAAALGVQIDINKVPELIMAVLRGDNYSLKQAALADPATTRALVKAGVVVGLVGFYDDSGSDMMTSVGLACSLCHVKVTKTKFQIFSQPEAMTQLPIGVPVLGPPNNDLDVGKILASTPLVQEGADKSRAHEYISWGPGRIDTRFFPGSIVDDGVSNPSEIPQNWNYVDQSKYGYPLTWSGVLLSTSNNDSIASVVERGNDFVLGVNGAWLTDNAVIDNFEFSNYPPQWVVDAAILAEQAEPGNAIEESLYRAKLLDLQAFVNSIVSPPAGDFNESMAVDGMRLFFGEANCVSCHTTPEGTGRPDERFTHIVENTPQGLLASGIKVPGLRGLVLTAPYFHDGSASTLADVVARYTSTSIPEVPSTLTFYEQEALVEYLKSL
jgi:hypothetical protein